MSDVILELPKNTLRTTLGSYKTRFEDAILEFLVQILNNLNDFAATKHSITERGAVPLTNLHLSLGSPRLKNVNTMANLQDLKTELDEEAHFDVLQIKNILQHNNTLRYIVLTWIP